MENILKRPDTYVGSVGRETETHFVFDDESKRMVQRKVSYVPGDDILPPLIFS